MLHLRAVGTKGLVAFACLVTPSARGANIAVSGFNKDVVTEAAAGAAAQPFDGYRDAWIETGHVDRYHLVAHAGLPGSRQIQSATGSGVTYELQPYDRANVLRLGGDDPKTGTINVTPGHYSSLHILSTTAAAPLSETNSHPEFAPGSFSLRLTFDDTTSVYAVPTHDWDISNPSAPGRIPPVAISVSDRFFNDYVDHRPTPTFSLFEATLDLTARGLSGHELRSVTASFPTTLGGVVGVFAIDGTPVPEPGAAALTTLAGAALLGRRRRT